MNIRFSVATCRYPKIAKLDGLFSDTTACAWFTPELKNKWMMSDDAIQRLTNIGFEGLNGLNLTAMLLKVHQARKRMESMGSLSALKEARLHQWLGLRIAIATAAIIQLVYIRIYIRIYNTYKWHQAKISTLEFLLGLKQPFLPFCILLSDGVCWPLGWWSHTCSEEFHHLYIDIYRYIVNTFPMNTSI